MPRPLFPVPLGQTKIYLYAKDVDMRKSFDGLHALIQSEFRRDVRQGDLFLFLNRRLDRIKLMHWDTDGLVIWMKRLERAPSSDPAVRRRPSMSSLTRPTWRSCSRGSNSRV